MKVKYVFKWRVLYEIYKNHNVSNFCNRMINIFLNKHSRNTKYHVTNVNENKSIMLQSFEEKQKYHVTKVWKKSNSVIKCISRRVLYKLLWNDDESNICDRKISILTNKNIKEKKVSCYNVYENKSIVLQSFEEKQKYHVTVRVGLRNSAAVFETIASEKRCRANDIHVLWHHLFTKILRNA